MLGGWRAVSQRPLTHTRGVQAPGTGKVSVCRCRWARAQGRCRYRCRREAEPGPAPAGAVLLGPAALRKRRGGRAVRRRWVSEGREGGREGPAVTVPAGRARTRPGRLGCRQQLGADGLLVWAAVCAVPGRLHSPGPPRQGRCCS